MPSLADTEWPTSNKSSPINLHRYYLGRSIAIAVFVAARVSLKVLCVDEKLRSRLWSERGRICMTNNAAERALRGFALGRKAWLFAGSDRGADRAAVMATLIMTARLNNIDPKPGSLTSWLALPARRKAGCTTYCRGTGRLPRRRPPLRRRSHARQ